MQVGVVLGQIPVTFDVRRNVESLLGLVAEASTGDVVLAPEGALTGYPAGGADELSLLERADQEEVRRGLDQVAAAAAAAGVSLWAGACVRASGWINAAVGLLPDGTRRVYRKVNLAEVERGTFVAGNALPVFPLETPGGGAFRVGVQICREARFPEQWQRLASGGADVFLHPNNARGPAPDARVWRSLLVSRAVENQRFVASANAVSAAQGAPSVVVAPSGEIVVELPLGRPAVTRVELDLDLVSGHHLAQRRSDLFGDP